MLEAKVDSNAHKLSRLLKLSSGMFKKDPEKNKKWWDLLGAEELESKHVAKKMAN
jgi:ribosomal protein S3AE